MNYQKQATDFLEKTNTTIEIVFSRNGYHFENDKETRDIYTITLKRGARSYTFDFGQSIANSANYCMMGKQRVEIPDSITKENAAITWLVKHGYQYLIGAKSDSIHLRKAPTAYDVLACLQKYDVGTFENFCSEFGYDEDSRTAEKVYKAVCEEYLNVCKLWSDSEIEELAEIQ